MDGDDEEAVDEDKADESIGSADARVMVGIFDEGMSGEDEDSTSKACTARALDCMRSRTGSSTSTATSFGNTWTTRPAPSPAP